jgi:glutamyl-tRNA synthetase
MNKNIRVRFAPSPTGGLHLGGVRTVLYNYLFAKKHSGTFVVRTEDTDQTRFVEGAEQYIFDCLKWCGLQADESTQVGGPFAPYKQSERKEIYKQYALQLVNQGNAYYAFDTSDELEVMRNKLKEAGSHQLQYDHTVRLKMNNSLRLTETETKALLKEGKPYVIRIKVTPNETVKINDLIRGEVVFDTSLLDDKVLLKADGMPTYHLAVVVDDYLMKISHAFRGEEWLPSAPIHILLWRYLGWLNDMPQWAHLPLILKPDGNGKLSKRDGERLGFPVYALQWQDAATKEITEGFKEKGFLPEAFLNILAMLGWNSGTQQELFSIDELIENFEIKDVHKGGAKFDFEKAKWFNHQWINKLPSSHYLNEVKLILAKKEITPANDFLLTVMDLIKDRCHTLNDFWDQGYFFFTAPTSIDLESIKPKWNEEKTVFFNSLIAAFKNQDIWDADNLEIVFKNLAALKNIKMGELQLPFRIMLVGGKFGPSVFNIASLLGRETTIERIEKVMNLL